MRGWYFSGSLLSRMKSTSLIVSRVRRVSKCCRCLSFHENELLPYVAYHIPGASDRYPAYRSASGIALSPILYEDRMSGAADIHECKALKRILPWIPDRNFLSLLLSMGEKVRTALTIHARSAMESPRYGKNQEYGRYGRHQVFRHFLKAFHPPAVPSCSITSQLYVGNPQFWPFTEKSSGGAPAWPFILK